MNFFDQTRELKDQLDATSTLGLAQLTTRTSGICDRINATEPEIKILARLVAQRILLCDIEQQTDHKEIKTLQRIHNIIFKETEQIKNDSKLPETRLYLLHRAANMLGTTCATGSPNDVDERIKHCAKNFK